MGCSRWSVCSDERPSLARAELLRVESDKGTSGYRGRGRGFDCAAVANCVEFGLGLAAEHRGRARVARKGGCRGAV